MLKPHEMTSVLISGPNRVLASVVSELHEMKVVHIVNHSKDENTDIGKPLMDADVLSESLVRVRSLISSLNIKSNGKKFKNGVKLRDVEIRSKKIAAELNGFNDGQKSIEDQTSKNMLSTSELNLLKDFDISLESLSDYKSIKWYSGFFKDESKLSQLKKSISKITDKSMILESNSGGKIFAVIFVDSKSNEKVAELLKNSGFSAVVFSSLEGLKGNAKSNLRKFEEEISKLNTQKEELSAKKQKLSDENRAFLLISEKMLSIELEKQEAPLRFASTKRSFLVKGWVPSENLKELSARLNLVTENRVFIHSQKPSKKDDVPIKQNNPAPVNSFETLMDLYTMPTYKELDPTFFMFLTFPIFFGFMLGDIGYGIVTLILFTILRKMMPSVKKFFNVLIIASIASILFGFVFGEFFGYEELGEFHIPHLISRSHESMKLIYVAVAIGLVHLNMGFIIGFFNELKSHGFVHAMNAKLGWIVLQIGIALAALSYLKLIVLPVYVGIVFFVLSLVMLFKGEGVRGLIELPSIFSNTLSYARLMAIGLSSVKLAEVINESAGEMFHSGGFMVLAGVLVLVIGHLINIALGSFGSFLHSLRLHYVEFFTKFFTGGAKKYVPFGEKD